MRAFVEALRSVNHRDLVALGIEIGAALLLFAAAAGLAQIGAVILPMLETVP